MSVYRDLSLMLLSMYNQFQLMENSNFLSCIGSFMLIGVILLVIAPTNSFAFNDIQQIKTQDSSGCDPSSTCRNSGLNVASVPDGDNNVIHQNLDQINRCNTNSKCSNTPNDSTIIVDNPVGNSIALTGDENSVNQEIQSSNDCNFSTCDNKVDLGAEIIGSRNILVQQAIQHNDCSGS